MKLTRAAKVVIIIIVLIVASVVVLPVAFSEYIAGTPLPPLQLPEPGAGVTNTDLTPTDGTWAVVDESTAGFRVGESFLLQSGTIVGRTNAVTGSLVISAGAITSASFQIDLSQVVITINKQTNNLARILDTTTYPDATFTLTDPVDLQQSSAQAVGSLSMNNITHSTPLALAGRYDGSQLMAVGSTSILLADWGIKNPFGIHDHAEIEFLVILEKS